MMRAYIGAEVFDGHALSSGRAVLVEAGRVTSIVPEAEVPGGCTQSMLSGGVIAPGFVDLQVNGGGGVLFNDKTDVDGVRIMAQAHGALGTAGFLPTLITDTPERVTAAIAAVEAALADGVEGVLGLHLEGPHLDPARKGAHDAALIREMTDADCAELVSAAARLPNLMVTLAPEAVSVTRIARLADAGVIVSLGHTDCSYEGACAAFDAGARCVTHLFNAMSGLSHRAPGLVGAALDRDVSVGLIADGVHVHPAAMRAALRAKSTGNIFLVTDAMAVAGSDLTEFKLNGRRVLRRDGRLTLEDGTLAGADLAMARAVDVLVQSGMTRQDALRRATSIPAGVLRDPQGCGRLIPGARAIHIEERKVQWLK